VHGYVLVLVSVARIVEAIVDRDTNDKACGDNQRLTEQQVLAREQPLQDARDEQAKNATHHCGWSEKKLDELHVGGFVTPNV